MEIQVDPVPVHDHLIEIWGRLPEEILAQEEEKMRASYAVLAGRIIALSKVREALQNEHTIST